MEPARRRIFQDTGEGPSVHLVPFADKVANQQFRVPLNRRVSVTVAALMFVQLLVEPSPLFHADERPDLIDLHVADRDVPQRLAQEQVAPLADVQNQVADRVARNPQEPLDGPNRHAVKQQLQALNSLVGLEPHFPKGLHASDERLSA